MGLLKSLLAMFVFGLTCSILIANENNPPLCPPHDFFNVPISKNCSGSVRLLSARNVTIKQYTNYSPSWVIECSCGYYYVSKKCKRCGYTEVTDKRFHPWGRYYPGANGDGTIGGSTPGTRSFGLLVRCFECGFEASDGGTITVVPYYNPTGPEPPEPSPPESPAPPSPPEDPTTPPEQEGPSLPPSSSGEVSIALKGPAAPQPMYVDIHGLPEAAKRPQQEEEKDQPDSFFRIDVGSLMPSISVADISIPVGNGDLKLEVRRSYQIENSGAPPAGFPLGFGEAWRSNFQARAEVGQLTLINTTSGSIFGRISTTLKVYDETGTEYVFTADGIPDQSTTQSYSPVTNGFASAAAFGSSVVRDSTTNTITWTRKFGTRYIFQPINSATYRLAQVVDRNGNAIEYQYSTQPGQLTWPVKLVYVPANADQSAAIALTVAYGTAGQITSVTDPAGNTYNYNYEIKGGKYFLTSVQQPAVGVYENGAVVSERPTFRYTYNLNRSTIEWCSLHYYFEDSNRYAVGNTNTGYNLISSITYPNGNAVTFQYVNDILYNDVITPRKALVLSQVTSPDGTVKFEQMDACGPRFRTDLARCYDNRIINRVTDTNGNVWQYCFEQPVISGGFSVTQVSSGGGTPIRSSLKSFSYAQTRRTFLGSQSDKSDSGPTAVWEYGFETNYASNLIRATDEDGASITYVYNPPVTTLLPSNDPVKIYPYPQYNNTRGELRYDYNLKKYVGKYFTYDPTFHVMTSVSDTDYAPDSSAGSAGALDTANEVKSVYTLDAKGNRLREVTKKGGEAVRTLQFEYDDYGLVKKTVDGAGRVTLYQRQYTASGWQDTATVKGCNDELNIVTVKKFDKRGLLLEETDGNGNTTSYQYNTLGKLEKITRPAVINPATGQSVQPTVEYRRTVMGQVAAQKDENGTWTYFTYDNMFRLLSKRIDVTGSDDVTEQYTYDAAGNRKTYTDPLGCVTTYTYDGRRRLISESRPNPSGPPLVTAYAYGRFAGNDIFSDSWFQPTRVTDPKGIATELTYDSLFQVTNKKRSGISLESYEYDRKGNVQKKTLHNSSPGSGDQVFTYTYDAFHQPLTESLALTSSVNLVTRYVYDASGKPVQLVDAEGNTTSFVYDGAGRPTKRTVDLDATHSAVTELSYDANGNVITAVLRNGAAANGSGDQTTSMQYDALNRLMVRKDALNHTESFAYDLAGNPVRKTDKLGRVTVTEFDQLNRPVKETLPAVLDGESGTVTSPVTTTIYNKKGAVLRQTDPRGFLTVNTYNILGQLTQQVVGSGSSTPLTTTYQYDANGNVTREQVMRGSTPLVTQTQYDNFNRVIKVIDPESKTTSYTYDTVGNKLSSTDGRNYTTNYTYDKANRLTQTQLPSVSCYTAADSAALSVRPATLTTYDKVGRVLTTTDENGKVTTNVYDQGGRKLKTTDAAGGIVEYVYDAAGNPVKQTVRNTRSGGDRVTVWTYDLLNRKLTETLNPGVTGLERTTTNTYDANGNLLSLIRPDGKETGYAYDALNRLQMTGYLDAMEQNREYVYNLNGQITQVTENTHRTSYTYDLFGRVTAEKTSKKTGSAWTQQSVISSTYDAVGNRLTVSYPSGRGLNCTYDRRNLLTKVTATTSGGPAKETTYSYDNAGNRITMLMPNGVAAAYTFDAANRQTKITHTRNGVNLYTAAYRLDRAGNRLRIDESGSGRSNRILRYTYDNVYRLLSEADSTGATAVYTYDTAGNRLTKQLDGTTTTYTVNRLDQVTEAKNDTDLLASWSYNLNGELATRTTGGVTESFSYDRAGRLVDVSADGISSFSAVYDYRCRRLAKTENEVTVSYLYDGGESVQEYDSQGSLTTHLVRAGGYGGGIGSVIYTENGLGANREYFLYNLLGSTAALCNDAGAVTATNCYGAWGVVASSTGNNDNERLFCTKERSASLKLDYFGFRYYDGELGRFISRDPSGYPDGPNNYLYCRNNPVNLIDVLGLEALDEKTIPLEQTFFAQRYRALEEEAPEDMQGVQRINSGSQAFMNFYISNIPVLHESLTFGAKQDASGRKLSDEEIAWEAVTTAVNLVGRLGTAAKKIVKESLGGAKGASSLLKQGDHAVDGARVWKQGEKAADGARVWKQGEKAADINNVSTQVSRLKENVEKGRLGEINAGIVKNTKHIPSQLPNKEYFIPDGIVNEHHFQEVKNVNFQSLTSQLKEDIKHVGPNGRVDLIIDVRTRVSKTLQELHNDPQNALNIIIKELNKKVE